MIYAAYRGDEFVDVGTAEELSERMGVKLDSLKFMSRPSHHKRTSYKALRVYKYEEGDDGEEKPVR